MNVSNFLSQFSPLEIGVPGVRLPSYQPSDRHKAELGLKNDVDNYEFLRALCLRGFAKLNIQKGPSYDEYVARVKNELAIFQELGFVDYVLLVWDVINYCTENDIPTGLGRGSAAGSLVLYLIGVTRIDPIKYGLYFERFVSKTRAKKTVVDGITYLDGSLMCDVDMDICYYRRPEVLEYIERKFQGKTSKILTFNTLSAKLLIKEIGKIVGSKSEEEMTGVTAMIPKLHGNVRDLEDTYNGIVDEKTGKVKEEPVKEFVEWVNANRRVYETAIKLKDLIKNKGVHPSGMLISYDKLEDSCPTELSSDKADVSSFDMNWVSLFTVKLDALGLRGVSVVDDVCKALKIKIEDINLDHPSIYQALQDLRYPHGLFQIEADLAFRTTQKVKPKNLGELSAVLALARPGAMQFIDKFALFTNTGTYESIHPFFDDIVKETGGVVLYQEQLMKMANKIGFSLDEAEILRRIVGKKKVEEMAKWESRVYEQVAKIGQPKEVGEVLWKVLDASKDYSFNKSHSVCYAALAAITVYLKFNHPTQFYLSLLKMTKHEPDPITEISIIHKEMPHFNIKLLPPNITKSQMDFTIEDGSIRFGLSSIKGISEKTVEKLNKFNRVSANKFELFESAENADLSINVVAALIQAGVYDGFGKSRPHLVYEAQLWNVLKEKEKRAAMILGPKMDYHLSNILRHIIANVKDEKGKTLIKESRVETIKKHTAGFKEIYEQNIASVDFANWFYEKRLMGYVANTTLLNIFKEKDDRLVSVHDVAESEADTKVTFVGYLVEDSTQGVSQTKRKSRYAKMLIADETGTMKTMIFNESLDECKDLNGRLPKEEDIVIVRGIRKGTDAVFANVIAVQQNHIYTKFSELKKYRESKQAPEQSQSGSSQPAQSTPTAAVAKP
jgi:DNA-directed DNA polymerase III PolC